MAKIDLKGTVKGNGKDVIDILEITHQPEKIPDLMGATLVDVKHIEGSEMFFLIFDKEDWEHKYSLPIRAE